MKTNLGLASKIWEVVYPVGMYYVAITIGIFAAQCFFGTGIENYMICKILGSLLAIPVIYPYYKHDLIFEGTYKQKFLFSSEVIKNIIIILICSACIGIGLNNVICMSPLVELSEGYEEASEAFYGSTIWLELLGSALITPILEELLHRGIVYKRLRNMFGLFPAIIVSAFIFAGLHFNIVQFLYAFLLGLVFAIFMEKAKHLYAPILAHIIANTIAVIRTETGILENTVDGSVFAWTVSVVLLIIGIGSILFYAKNEIKWNK